VRTNTEIDVEDDLDEPEVTARVIYVSPVALAIERGV